MEALRPPSPDQHPAKSNTHPFAYLGSCRACCCFAGRMAPQGLGASTVVATSSELSRHGSPHPLPHPGDVERHRRARHTRTQWHHLCSQRVSAHQPTHGEPPLPGFSWRLRVGAGEGSKCPARAEHLPLGQLATGAGCSWTNRPRNRAVGTASGLGSRAMALPAPLLNPPWRDQGLKRSPGSTPIKEQLWLVLPEGEQHHNTLQAIAQSLLSGLVGQLAT